MEILIKPLKKIIVQYHTVKEMPQVECWVTARGIEIPVKNMSTSHIKNCINCLHGRGNMRIPEGYLGGKEKWLTIFNKELISRN